jgi:elongator complex protein 3
VPYTKEKIADLIINMIQKTPRYCRIMRIMREIPPAYLIAGTKNIDMRKDIEEVIRKKKLKINEIRFREVGFALRDNRKVDDSLKLKVTKYKACDGTEYYLEIVNKDDLLFGLLRLRINKNKKLPATVREVHVYGPALKLGIEGKISQHKGLGKWLMTEAEKIAKKKGREKIRVISGVGVREYYRKTGYRLDKKGIYVEKKL